MDRYIVWLSKKLLLISLIGIAAFSFNLFIFQDDSVLLYDYKRIFVCTLVVLNASLILLSSSQRAWTLSSIASIDRKILSLIGILFIFSLIANLIGFYPMRGLVDLVYYLGLLLLCITFVQSKQSKLIFELISLISVLCFLSVFLGFIVSILYGEGKNIWTILSYTNPRMMNQVQVWLIPPSVYLIVISRSAKAWIPLLLNFALMFALEARGLAIASITGLLLWAALDKFKRIKILKVLFIGLLLGYGVKWLFLAPFPAYVLTGELQPLMDLRISDSGRLEMWFFALQNLSFWGHGGDAFACNSPFNARPHNSALLVAFNWGIISAICYVGLIAALLFKVIRLNNSRTRLWGITLLSGVAYSFISGVLDSPFSQLLAIITLAFFWSNCKNQTLGPTQSSLAKALLITISILIITFTTQRVLDRINNDFYLSEEYIPEVYTPQFWFGNNCVGVEKKIQ